MINRSSGEVDRAEVEPSFPRLMALDLAFSALAGKGGQDVPLLVVGATAGTMSEFVARGAGRIAFLDESKSPAPDTPGPDTEGAQFSRSLWSAPDPVAWQLTAARIDRHLLPGGRLAVVGSGPLADLLAHVRRGALGIPESAVRPHHIRRILGYRRIGEWRLYGMGSARWAMLRMVADRFRRSDLADRCQAAFQQSLVEPDSSRLWGITVLLTEKPKPHSGERQKPPGCR